MLQPLQAGDAGGVVFLLVVLVYLSGAVLFLLLPTLVVSRLREDRGLLDGLAGGRMGRLVRGRFGELVRGRVDDLHRLRRQGSVDSRNR